METLWQDVRYAARSLRRAPGFACAAVVTIALGIGANATVFSVVNSILIKPLPYEDSDRLVWLIETIPAGESMSGTVEQTSTMAPDVFVAWRARTRALSDMAMQRQMSMVLQQADGVTRLNGVQISASLLPMLGVAPALGRPFGAEHEAPGSEKVVLLSHNAWMTHFGGDPDIVGRLVMLDEAGYTIIGVMPPDLAFPDATTDFWVPLQLAPAPGQFMRFQVLAKLSDDESLAAASNEAAILARELLGNARVDVVRWKDELVAPARPALVVFAGAVILVLLIACVNVATLFLARAVGKEREIAVRLALGAGPLRLVRGLFVESSLLAALGGGAGCVLALFGTRLLRGFGQGLARFDLARLDVIGNTIPRVDEVAVDSTVLVYAAVLTIATAILFGLRPVGRVRRADLVHGTQQGAKASRPLRQSDRPALLVGQVALSMVLLLAAGLLMHSFAKLASVDAGYDPAQVLTFQITQPELRWPAPPGAQGRQTAVAERVVERLGALPGVDAAAFTNLLPMVQMRVLLALGTTRDADRTPIPDGTVVTVSEDYFRVMGIRVVSGRGFDESDRAAAVPSFVVNQTLARRYFGDDEPLGRVVYLAGGTEGRVVGIVNDLHQSSLTTQAEPQLFIDPHHTVGLIPVERGGLYFAVRTSMSAQAMAPQIRRIVRETDPTLPVHNVASMDQIVASSISSPRSYAVVSGVFAVVALVMAMIGLYSVMSYFVGQRTREFGVRMALGAGRREVLWLVLRQGFALTSGGIVLGLAGGAATTHFLDTMLFGLEPLDATTFAAAAVVFMTVAALACLIPARHATNVDPLVALRSE